jgi:DsbC/DsbD-like thiol-disulfide interchange protein
LKQFPNSGLKPARHSSEIPTLLLKELSMRLFLTLLLCILPFTVFAEAPSHLKAELLCETSALTPGKPVTFGVHLTMDSGWHTYWQNPGDAGLATSVVLKLPMGFHAGKMLWPIPQRITLPGVTDFGYENEAMLLIPVTVSKNLKPGESFKFTAKVQWLVCKETCVPGEAKLTIEVPVVSAPISTSPYSLFAKARENLPRRFPAEVAPVIGTLDDHQFQLAFKGLPVQQAYFFPLVPNQIDNASTQALQTTPTGFTLTIKRSDQLLANVQKLDGLLVVEGSGKRNGYEISVPLSQTK